MPRKGNMFHAFPVTRLELFVTGLLSGFLVLAFPIVVTSIVNIMVLTSFSAPAVCMSAALKWMVYELFVSYIGFSMAVFCCFITGHALGAAVYYYVFSLLYVVCKALIYGVIGLLSYGISIGYGLEGNDMCLSPLAMLFGSRMGLRIDFETDLVRSYSVPVGIHIEGKGFIAAYLIFFTILFFLSYIIYKKRHVEMAGDVLTIGWMKPIYRWIITGVTGFGLGLFFFTIFSEYSRKPNIAAYFATTLAFGIVGFIISEMILEKKFRIFTKKRMIECLAAAICLLAVLLCIRFDVTQTGKKVPATDEVASITVDYNYPMYFDSAEEIDVIRNIHQTIIDRRSDYEFIEYNGYYDSDGNRTYAYSSVSIDYELKNGKHLSRYYAIPDYSEDVYKNGTEPAAILSKLSNEAERYLAYEMGVTDCTGAELTAVSFGTLVSMPEEEYLKNPGLGDVYNYTTSANGESMVSVMVEQPIDLTKDEMKALLDAYIKEVEDGYVVSYGARNYDSTTEYSYLADDIRTYYSDYLVYKGYVPNAKLGRYGNGDEMVYATDGTAQKTFEIRVNLDSGRKTLIAEMIKLGIITSEADLNQ
ncbi:MAG: hypothetical protein K6E56_01295 [Lachnospiraceae bacterium]|nr:hypothetical protein [Lachnospiraceae bacterium]